MRLSILVVAVVLFSGSIVFAQHSGGGSSGGGGGSSSGGGGSHGGSSGGSSGGYSGGHSGGSSGGSGSSHSSGGSSSHASGGNGSRGHSSGGRSSGSGSSSHSGSSRTTINGSRSQSGHSSHEANSNLRAKTGAKTSFFSFLRHPFEKPKPAPKIKPDGDLRRRFCIHGSCAVCPAGHLGTAGCGQGIVVTRNRSYATCSRQDFSTGGSCFSQVHFLNDCEWLREQLQQQAEKLQAAREAERNACAGASQQGCESSTSRRQSEESFYSELENRYRNCSMESARRWPVLNSARPFIP